MKTKTLLLVGLVGALCAQARAADLWSAVLDLNRLGRQEQAADALRRAGRDGLQTLLRAARLGEPRRMLDRAAHAVGCISPPNMYVPMWRSQDAMGHGAASGPAVELAARMLAEQPDWAAELLASGQGFERQLGLIALCAHPQRLLGRLQELSAADAPDPVLMHPAMLIHWHYRKADEQPGAAIAAAAEALQQASTRVIDAQRCQAPGFADSELVAGLAAGRIAFHSGSHWPGGVRFRLLSDDGRALGLTPACTIAAYRALRQRHGPDRSLADLLVMIAADFSLPPAVRAEAAAALAGDLEHFSDLTARRMAAELVNAGFEVPLELAYDDAGRLPSPELHEAAIRQGNSFARDRVLATVVCPGWSRRQVALLGFAAAPGVADQAAAMARHCPGARAAAVAALIRLGDRRARGLLFSLLVSHRHLGLGDDPLLSALVDSGDGALLALIDEMAAVGNRGAVVLKRAVQRAQAGRAP